MLIVKFGLYDDCILNPDGYFNNVYEDEWLDDPLVQEMILDVDKSKVLSRHCIESPVLGQIAPERLSGGVKALICMYKEDGAIFDLIVCGPNCEKWIAKIASMKDITVGMSGYDLRFEGIDIHGLCLNDNSEFHGWKEWVLKMCTVDMNEETL